MSVHKVQKGDKVNDKERIPFANGFVIGILYDDGPSEVLVRFNNGVEYYDYTRFEFTWTDRYGGVFILD